VSTAIALVDTSAAHPFTNLRPPEPAKRLPLPSCSFTKLPREPPLRAAAGFSDSELPRAEALCAGARGRLFGRATASSCWGGGSLCLSAGVASGLKRRVRRQAQARREHHWAHHRSRFETCLADCACSGAGASGGVGAAVCSAGLKWGAGTSRRRAAGSTTACSVCTATPAGTGTRLRWSAMREKLPPPRGSRPPWRRTCASPLAPPAERGSCGSDDAALCHSVRRAAGAAAGAAAGGGRRALGASTVRPTSDTACVVRRSVRLWPGTFRSARAHQRGESASGEARREGRARQVCQHSRCGARSFHWRVLNHVVIVTRFHGACKWRNNTGRRAATRRGRREEE